MVNMQAHKLKARVCVTFENPASWQQIPKILSQQLVDVCLSSFLSACCIRCQIEMPTYKSIGVTATLATCDLQPSLNHATILRMGTEQKEDAARVDGLFSKARRLPERPIGADGSEKGVVQFIGVNEDMALFMVEAGENVGKKANNVPGSPQALEDPELADRGPPSSDSSPLTSPRQTPTPTQQSFVGGDRPPDVLMKDHDTLEKALRTAMQRNDSSKQALMLDVKMSPNSFLPPMNNKDGASASSRVSSKLRLTESDLAH